MKRRSFFRSLLGAAPVAAMAATAELQPTPRVDAGAVIYDASEHVMCKCGMWLPNLDRIPGTETYWRDDPEFPSRYFVTCANDQCHNYGKTFEVRRSRLTAKQIG